MLKIIGRVRDAAIWLHRFSRFTYLLFYRQRGLRVASALAYTTLLSIVPLLTVMFAFPGGLPMFKGVAGTIQSFLFHNFVPAFGETVQHYLGDFSKNASKLTATGIASLIIIALMLMETIDEALNAIWRVRNRRSPVGRFLLYWAMITLGPLLVGVGLVSTSYLLSLPMVSNVDTSFGLQRRLLSILPFLTSSVAFTLLYVLVPNCYVKRAHAIVGGIFAAILFECAKFGFGIYVRSLSAEEIYGTLATLPLFLVWIYTSWVIVLLGAYISFGLAGFSAARAQSGRDSEDWEFEDAFQVLGALWLAQKDGRSLSAEGFSVSGVRLATHHLGEILDHLERSHWVGRTAQGHWLLSRDLDEVTLWDLHHVIPRKLPLEAFSAATDRWRRALGDALDAHRADISRSLNVPLADILKGSE